MAHIKSDAERSFMRDVIGVVSELQLGWHHCGDPRLCQGNPAGFPDLMIIGQGGLIGAELKTELGDTTGEQDWWLWHMSNSGVMVRGELWRPSDLADGTIRALLNPIRLCFT